MRLAFLRNGQYLASASGDTTVRVYDMRSPQTPSRAYEGHQKPVQSVAFSPDGSKLVSGSWDKTLRLWDLPSNRSVTMTGHTDRVVSAVFSPDGRYIVSAAEDLLIRLWDGRTGKFIKILATQGLAVANLSFSPDGRSVRQVPVRTAQHNSTRKSIRSRTEEKGSPASPGMIQHNGELIVTGRTDCRDGRRYTQPDPSLATRPMGRKFADLWGRVNPFSK